MIFQPIGRQAPWSPIAALRTAIRAYQRREITLSELKEITLECRDLYDWQSEAMKAYCRDDNATGGE